MSIRKLGVILASVCASLLIIPVAAGAKTPTRATSPTPVAVHSFNHIPISGTASNHKRFTGHFNVSHFATRNGKTVAIGTLTGHIGKRYVKRSNVAIPLSVAKSTGLAPRQAVPPPACQILNLVLGPLHLNLLGLHVDLNQVILNVSAQPGNGQLLGNLLCSVANLLNGNPLAGQLTALANLINTLLSNPGLVGLLGL